MIKEQKWRVYFHPKTGSLVEWDGEVNAEGRICYGKEKPVVMLPAQRYWGTLVLDTYHRGRSAASFIFQNKAKPEQKLVMKISMMSDMLKETTMKKGEVFGTFSVVKQGANYSLCFLGDSAWSGGIPFEEITE